MIAAYESAIENIGEGKWSHARELLVQLPDDDGPKQFILMQMAACGNQPPSDWDGAFALNSK